MYVENNLQSLDPIYLSLLNSHKFSDNFSDMDVCAQGVLRYHIIEVPWSDRIRSMSDRIRHSTNDKRSLAPAGP